jgi:hypothetical protein
LLAKKRGSLAFADRASETSEFADAAMGIRAAAGFGFNKFAETSVQSERGTFRRSRISDGTLVLAIYRRWI